MCLCWGGGGLQFNLIGQMRIQSETLSVETPWGEHYAHHHPHHTDVAVPVTNTSILATQSSLVNQRIREAMFIRDRQSVCEQGLWLEVAFCTRCERCETCMYSAWSECRCCIVFSTTSETASLFVSVMSLLAGCTCR